MPQGGALDVKFGHPRQALLHGFRPMYKPPLDQLKRLQRFDRDLLLLLYPL